MPGLMNGKKQTAERFPPREVGRADPKRVDAGGEPAPGQKVYETFVKNGIKLIHSESSLPAIIQALDGDGNPPQGIANALMLVVKRLEDSAAQKGAEIPEDVIEQGKRELMQHLAYLSKESGGHTYTKDELAQALKFTEVMGNEMMAGMQGGEPGAEAGPVEEPAPRRGLMQPSAA